MIDLSLIAGGYVSGDLEEEGVASRPVLSKVPPNIVLSWNVDKVVDWLTKEMKLSDDVVAAAKVIISITIHGCDIQFMMSFAFKMMNFVIPTSRRRALTDRCWL